MFNRHYGGMVSHDSRAKVHNVQIALGPTNTGKTHLAMTRMLGHSSGMIGLPLRLLAREIYDRVLKGDFTASGHKVNPADVALITGEEKIIPPHPRYYICTTEAMPLNKLVSFLAVDEIQLAADSARGHIFTDRILRARGSQETMLLGSETMRVMVRRLLPDAEIMTRPRLSRLRWAGAQKLSRLQRRSAIVGFSAAIVYDLAARIRQNKGGAAIVMGALSPRTRNAQVAMYQAGEVDYLVATDAIGMGLNMDIEHVAFAASHKFDGRGRRALSSAELAQIAGRAGRHRRDGTFGVSAHHPPLADEVIARIEAHEFAPLKMLMWRNHALDFSTLADLRASLAVSPPHAGLRRVHNVDDMRALDAIADMSEIVARLTDSAALRLLWEVVQIPDFRKTLTHEHAHLLAQIFMFLSSDARVIPADWLAGRIAQCDRIDGDLDTLATRLAHIRTWTYLTHKTAWIDDASDWQSAARGVENRLSDALHEGLTRQFVDRQSMALVQKLALHQDIIAALDNRGDITIERSFAGRLNGLKLERDPRLVEANGAAARTARRAIDRAAHNGLRARAITIAQSPDDAFSLTSDATLYWQFQLGREAIAHLAAPPQSTTNPAAIWHNPVARIDADELLDGAPRLAAEQRLTAWLRAHAQELLAPLIKLDNIAFDNSAARGLVFQLIEAGGSLKRRDVATLLTHLDRDSRTQLREHGIWFGYYNIFIPALLAPKCAHYLVAALSRFHNRDACADTAALPQKDWAKRDPNISPALYRAGGFHILGNYALRMDVLERIGRILRKQIKKNKQKTRQITITAPIRTLFGDASTPIIRALGYKTDAPSPNTKRTRSRRSRRRKPSPPKAA